MNETDLIHSVKVTIDLKDGLVRKAMIGQLMKGDKKANRVIVAIENGKEKADLTNIEVTGSFIRPPDGAEVPLQGTKNDNEAVVLLEDVCYENEGYCEINVKLTIGSTMRTVLSLTGNVLSKGSGAYIDVSNVIPSLDDIISQYGKMQEVTEAAKSATQASTTQTEAAKKATDDANQAAEGADGWARATISAELLAPGSQPTTNVETAPDGQKIIHLGIPKGDTGATPRLVFEVATGLPGTDVKVSVTGTAEEPHILLTIPRGNTGSIENMPYYENAPKPLGTTGMPGTDENVARGDHVHPLPTAEQVGARPNTWTPTADDVGALAKDAKAADSTKLDGKDASHYMADYGRGAVLWEGEWSDGTITVPNTEQYTGFQIIMSDISSTILAMKHDGKIRGVGGYGTSSTAYSYHFSANHSGDEWTFSSCRSITHKPDGNHGAGSTQTIARIIGLF